MLGKVLLAGLVMFLGAGAIEAQPAAPSGGGPGQGQAQVPPKDPADLKLQEALARAGCDYPQPPGTRFRTGVEGERRIYERRERE